MNIISTRFDKRTTFDESLSESCGTSGFTGATLTPHKWMNLAHIQPFNRSRCAVWTDVHVCIVYRLDDRRERLYGVCRSGRNRKPFNAATDRLTEPRPLQISAILHRDSSSRQRRPTVRLGRRCRVACLGEFFPRDRGSIRRVETRERVHGLLNPSSAF